MRAVVLVGGEGTRLRPLTETIPKPLLPLMDRPSLDHVLDHLARHGVHEVVLSSPYLESTFHDFIEARRDPTITWITEREPLGTGGAIVHALEHLGLEPFLALNGDILTDLDLTEMAAFHRERAADATIALHHVEDARAFGLVATGPDGRVVAVREKPEEPVPGDVNAGTYVLEPSALAGWIGSGNVSIERRIFPALIDEGRRGSGRVTRRVSAHPRPPSRPPSTSSRGRWGASAIPPRTWPTERSSIAKHTSADGWSWGRAHR